MCVAGFRELEGAAFEDDGEADHGEDGDGDAECASFGDGGEALIDGDAVGEGVGVGGGDDGAVGDGVGEWDAEFDDACAALLCGEEEGRGGFEGGVAGGEEGAEEFAVFFAARLKVWVRRFMAWVSFWRWSASRYSTWGRLGKKGYVRSVGVWENCGTVALRRDLSAGLEGRWKDDRIRGVCLFLIQPHCIDPQPVEGCGSITVEGDRATFIFPFHILSSLVWANKKARGSVGGRAGFGVG